MVDVGSTIIRIENRSAGATFVAPRKSQSERVGAARRRGLETKEQETGERNRVKRVDSPGRGDETEKEGVRVEEFLGSSRPRYAGKSEIDWRTRPVSGRLRDADIDADAEVARQVDSEPWLNSANELRRWSVRKRGVGCASKTRPAENRLLDPSDLLTGTGIASAN